MKIAIFDNKANGSNSSATGAVNYILSSKDWKGNLRAVEPRILHGSPEFTKKIDELYCQKFTNKCISGVIAFADGEDIADEQKRKLINDFENTFFGNLRENVNAVYVEHRDKGNLEIHFVINRVAIFDDGRAMAYNPFPPGDMTIELKDAFRDLQNEKFGFKHVTEKPSKLSKSQQSKKSARLHEKENNGFLYLDNKEKFENAMRQLVKDGTVKSRDELLKFLVAQGLKVKNTGKSISVENPHVKEGSDYEKKYGNYWRFSGGIFERNNDKSYQELKDEVKERAVKPKDFEAIARKLERLVEARNNYNAKRYQAKDKKLPKFAERIAQAVAERTPKPADQVGHLVKQDTPQEAVKQPLNPQASQGERDEQGTSHEAHSDTSTGAEAMSAQDAVNNARSALANAKTPEQAEKARIRLGIAQARLNAILARLAAEQNKTKLKL